MDKSDTVLITGATGFIGSAVVRALRASGYRLRALVRATSPLANLSGIVIECITGDICDAPAVRLAMKDVRFVFHVAADYRLWSRHPQEILNTNIEGTRTVMQAALAAKVERIVYTSSVAALALREQGASSDESVALKPEDAIGAYKRSKVLAQELVEKMIAHDALPAIIVNPSTPIGPYDIRPTPTGRMIVEAATGRMPAFVDTGLNLVHVDDVAQGHLAALTRGRMGERYILGGENVSLADMLASIAQLTGRRPPRLRIPRLAVYPLALAAEMAARYTAREPFITLDGLRMARHHMFFTSDKAHRELGYEARPYQEALSAAIEWFEREGYLKK